MAFAIQGIRTRGVAFYRGYFGYRARTRQFQSGYRRLLRRRVYFHADDYFSERRTRFCNHLSERAPFYEKNARRNRYECNDFHDSNFNIAVIFIPFGMENHRISIFKSANDECKLAVDKVYFLSVIIIGGIILFRWNCYSDGLYFFYIRNRVDTVLL